MKTSNYLIALAALTSFTLVGCSDNDFLGSGPEIQGTTSQGQLAFRTSGNNKITRGEITGEDAATKLNKKFTVYGWKYVNTSSDAAATGYEDVFQDYVVKWEGVASMGTTESNTSGWEYVGYQSEPVDPSESSYDQTIKYWDWSTTRYDFIAWSISEGNASIVTRNKVAGNSTKTSVKEAPGLTFYAPRAIDLGGIYASDKFTSRPDNGGSWNSDDWADSYAGLANVETHPDADYHRGLYSQLGTNVTANQEKGIVNLQFRNLAAKVRIGIYETIPGYKVSDVVFYRQNGAENVGEDPIASGFTDYLNNWKFTDSSGDYNADQLYATLYAADDIFVKRGNIDVKYHDAYYYSSDKEKDNVAYATVVPTEAADYFAFGKLTNERGSTTPIASNPIGETSSTASMSIGNDKEKLYTYVFPMEENTNVLKLKVNYLLTSIDGSKENIRVTGANAVVPVEFAKWRANYAYTYLFKISDNTNGYTNPSAGPAGLYPITFDACLVNTEDGMQETITTVNDKSITTYQDGSKVTANNEYKLSNDIYFTVEGAETEGEETPGPNNELLTLVTTGTTQNVWLYTAWAADPSIITEEAVANYKANNIVLTDVTSSLTAAEEAPNSSGAQYSIKFAEGKALKFAPVAKYYVIKAQYEDATGVGTKKYITYKVVKIEDGSTDISYVISGAPASVNENETFDVTVTNGGKVVTGAAGAFTISNKKLTVEETSTPGTYTFTAEEGIGTGTVTITLGTLTSPAGPNTISVNTKAYSFTNASVATSTTTGVITLYLGGTGESNIVGSDKSANFTIKKADGTAATSADIVLTFNSTNKNYEINAKKAGTYTVTYLGTSSTITVVPYTLSFADKYVNVDKTTDVTLATAATDAVANGVSGITLVASPTGATGLTTDASGVATISPSVAGKLTLTYADAEASITVKDFALTNLKANVNATGDDVASAGVGTYYIKLTEGGDPVNGAQFTVSDASHVTVSSTSVDGVYKVEIKTGFSSASKITYKYQNIIMQEITLPL
jgi:predicted small secreted protein